ncbi:hypothetical protein DRW07_04675 [Alteromonas sediminis]|uniref:Uncharacterized protein n=1 Tax=Alteromonas sediminis TaxID=2259342 RepID=A0A3N5ZBI2_9ALTE|nr:hypothetical protein [Alteromonas sediminis]RPJ68694.1 hypothetical protein DRW07_04675 [Alteromonas sediminis]
MPKTDVDKMLAKHKQLIHLPNVQVVSHVQRSEDDWHVNTIMLDGYEVPFKFKRKKRYRSLKGARVNLTYYPILEEIAGIEFEVMKVVRIKVA